ncbi:hypothetical protein MRX96_014005 [Rhipicephalus microplus]
MHGVLNPTLLSSDSGASCLREPRFRVTLWRYHGGHFCASGANDATTFCRLVTTPAQCRLDLEMLRRDGLRLEDE